MVCCFWSRRLLLVSSASSGLVSFCSLWGRKISLWELLLAVGRSAIFVSLFWSRQLNGLGLTASSRTVAVLPIHGAALLGPPGQDPQTGSKRAREATRPSVQAPPWANHEREQVFINTRTAFTANLYSTRPSGRGRQADETRRSRRDQKKPTRPEEAHETRRS